MTNGISHPYHLDPSIFIFRGVRSSFSFFISFSDEIHLSKQNIPRWKRFTASHLGLFCLPMSHKKERIHISYFSLLPNPFSKCAMFIICLYVYLIKIIKILFKPKEARLIWVNSQFIRTFIATRHVI